MTSEQDRTIVYPTVVHKMQAEAAIEQMADETNKRRRVDEILGLDKPLHGYTEKIVDLGEDCYVVEVRNALGRKDRILWSVIVDGVHVNRLFESLSLALLGYVEARHNGTVDYSTHTAAARVLRVPVED